MKPIRIAGKLGGTYGFADGALNTSGFDCPTDLALSPDGTLLYIADCNNGAIRVLDTDTNLVSTLALLTDSTTGDTPVRIIGMWVNPTNGNIWTSSYNSLGPPAHSIIHKTTPGGTSTEEALVSDGGAWTGGIVVSNDETQALVKYPVSAYSSGWFRLDLTVPFPSSIAWPPDHHALVPPSDSRRYHADGAFAWTEGMCPIHGDDLTGSLMFVHNYVYPSTNAVCLAAAFDSADSPYGGPHDWINDGNDEITLHTYLLGTDPLLNRGIGGVQVCQGPPGFMYGSLHNYAGGDPFMRAMGVGYAYDGDGFVIDDFRYLVPGYQFATMGIAYREEDDKLWWSTGHRSFVPNVSDSYYQYNQIWTTRSTGFVMGGFEF